MKIPKSLKLPRKLKKEVKKGITRNVHTSPMKFSSFPDKISVCSFFYYTYLGSNTKSFFRLCKVMRKEEKRTMRINFEKMFENLNEHTRVQFWNTAQRKMYEGLSMSFDPAEGYSKSAIFLAEFQGIHLRNTEIHAIIPNL